MFSTIQLKETNTKQFPKHRLFFLEVLEQTKKGLEKNNLPSHLLKIAAFNLTPIFGPNALSSVI